MLLTEQKISKKFLISLIKEMLRGKSLPRTFLNLNLREFELDGEVLDLGSKSSGASYNRFFRKGSNCRITYTDWHEDGEDIIKLNLEESFPVEDNKYDVITCFNVLEHIFNFNNLATESFRILKSGGIYIGQTPFLVNYHADPSDYFRYTHESIEKIFSRAGFICEKMIFLGVGPLTASFSLRSHIIPNFLRPLCAVFMILTDLFILKFKKSQKLRYPLGYLYIMKKK